MADTKANFDALRSNGVIPADQDLDSLPDDVKQALGDLEDEHVKALIQLAKTSNSHLAFHDKDGGIVVCGL